MTAATGQTPGALVISLDFELHWGRPELPLSDAGVRARFLRTRDVIPAILRVFTAFDVAATWATVGRLFAHSTSEIEEIRPRQVPSYRSVHGADSIRTGTSENDDPFHFAPSLIEHIRNTPRQEIGTHTFDHFYCLEAGQSKQDFAADLASAREIARRRGITLSAIAFPRNQVNNDYRSVLMDMGITCYRGNPPGIWQASDTASSRMPVRRALRFVDSAVQWSGRKCATWQDVVESDGLANVRATSFLRPFDARLGRAEEFRLRRILSTLEAAARSGTIVHLWWHPHNFAADPTRNLDCLQRILSVFARCRTGTGMVSLTMSELADKARSRLVSHPTRSVGPFPLES